MGILSSVLLLSMQVSVLSNNPELLMEVAEHNAAVGPPAAFLAEYVVTIGNGELGEVNSAVVPSSSGKISTTETVLARDGEKYFHSESIVERNATGDLIEAYKRDSFYDEQTLCTAIHSMENLVPTYEEYVKPAAPKADDDFSRRLNGSLTADLAHFWGKGESVGLKSVIERNLDTCFWELTETSPKVYSVKCFRAEENRKGALNSEYMVDGNRGYFITSLKGYKKDGVCHYEARVEPMQVKDVWVPKRVSTLRHRMKTDIVVTKVELDHKLTPEMLTWAARKIDVSDGVHLRVKADGTREQLNFNPAHPIRVQTGKI